MRFVLNRDQAKRISVAPLQGETGQALLRRAGLSTEDFDSLVFFPAAGQDGSLLRTDGVVAVLKLLPQPWRRLGGVLAVLPQGFRDGGYRLVAGTRHRVFGDPRPGGLDRPEWAERVLP